jgi:hypothetical protein
MLNAFSGIAQVSNVEKVEETEEEIDKRIQALTEKRAKIRIQTQLKECASVVLEELKDSSADKVRQLNIKKEEIDKEINKLNGDLETFNNVEDVLQFVELNYPDKLADSIKRDDLQKLVQVPITQPPRAHHPSAQQLRKAQWNELIDEKQKMFLVYKGKKAEFHKENVGVKMTTDWNGKKCNTRYETANCLVKTMYRDLGATNTPNAWEVIKVMKGTKKVSLGVFVA